MRDFPRNGREKIKTLKEDKQMTEKRLDLQKKTARQKRLDLRNKAARQKKQDQQKRKHSRTAQILPRAAAR